MSNLSNNRVNITATPAQVTEVKTAFQTILNNFPFLVGLTAEERKSLQTIDVGNKVFTEDALNAAVNNKALVPAYVSVEALQNDFALFIQLDEISGMANQLCQRLEDTKMLAGSEAYQVALTLYRAFGTAANAGEPGAATVVEQLKKRFPSNSGSATSKTVPTTPVQ
jgi:hypothetical protein